MCFILADTCLSPEIKSVAYYTGGDTSLSTETAVILEFSLSCKNGLKVNEMCTDQALKAMLGQSVITGKPYLVLTESQVELRWLRL